MNSPIRDRTLYAAVVCLALGLGLYIHWPSLDAGLRSDDYPQRAMLRGEFAVPRAPLDLFSFSSGDPRDVYQLMDFGYLPWWSVPDLRLRMWRPIASALIVLDQRVLDLSPVLQHAHSLLWYALLVIAAARVFRSWLSLPAAAIATLAFAIEEGHTVPVGWLANRSTLVATAFGLLTLELHARAREAVPGRRRLLERLATATCAALALLSGEYAFTALAYVFAYECLRDEPIRDRLRGSVPVVAPTLVYLVVHSAIGSDIVGSGFYISPLRDPLAFASAAVMRVPAMLADLVFGIPAEWFNSSGPFRNFFLKRGWFSPRIWHMFPPWPYWHAAAGYLALGLGWLLLRISTRRAPEACRRPLQVMALGAVLSLAPAAGSLPGDRLIVAGAFGVSGVFGAALAYARPRRGIISAGVTAAWLLALIVAGPLTFYRVWNQAGGYAFGAEGARLWSRAADLPIGPDASHTRVYVLGTSDFTTAVNLPWIRHAEGLRLPKSYRRLCPAVLPFDVHRTGERSLRITVLSSDLLYSAQPTLYRSAAAPIRERQMVRLPGLDVIVAKVRDGNPAVMHFEFDRPLEDPSLWFVKTTLDGLARFEVPKVGETVRVVRPVYRDLRLPIEPP